MLLHKVTVGIWLCIFTGSTLPVGVIQPRPLCKARTPDTQVLGCRLGGRNKRLFRQYPRNSSPVTNCLVASNCSANSKYRSTNSGAAAYAFPQHLSASESACSILGVIINSNLFSGLVEYHTSLLCQPPNAKKPPKGGLVFSLTNVRRCGSALAGYTTELSQGLACGCPCSRHG